MYSLKKFLKKIKFIVFLNNFIKNLIDKLYSMTLCILIYLLPRQVSKLLAEQGRGLPSYNNRIRLEAKVFDEWDIGYKGEKIFNEINIIVSQNYENEKNLNYDIPSFFVNYYGDKKNKFSDAYGITSDENIFMRMYSNNIFPTIYTSKIDRQSRNFIKMLSANNQKFENRELKFYSNNCYVKLKCKDQVSSGSAIASIISLSSISKKINIYGWDSYLERKISSMTNLEVIFGLIAKPKNNYKRWKYIAPNLFNYVYAYRIKTNCENIIINGNLSDVHIFKKLMMRLKKLIYF
tara:strand:- start:3648 stop:4523 length:876 start_codon:yes stop_codon:yes gene_type:complete